MQYITKILLISFFSFFAATLIAQEQTAPAVIVPETVKKAPPPQRYTVEILFFEQANNNQSEVFPDEIIPPDKGIATLTLHQENDLDGVTKILPATLPEGFEFLTKKEFQFPQFDYALKKRGLRPILHLGWRQVIPDLGNSEWYWLEKGNFRGLIKLTKGRFLHIDTDLLLEHPDLQESFTIKNHRKMRRSEMHHIDHPKLGIIIQIDRYKEPEMIIEDSIDDEPLGIEMVPPAKTSSNN